MAANYALASAALASQGSLPILLSASITVSAVTSNEITVLRALSSSVSVSGSITGDVKLVNNAGSSIDASGSITGDVKLNNNLVTSLSVSGSITGDAKLDNSASANITAAVTSDVAAPFILNPLSTSVQATNVTSTVLNIDKLLQATIDISGDVSGEIVVVYPNSSSLNVTGSVANAYLFVANNILGDIQVIVTSNVSETVQKDLSASIESLTINDAELNVSKNLSGSLLIDTDISVGVPLFCNAQVSVNAYPLLNVNGNVTGSPGGPSVDGFIPLSSLRLIRQSETSDPETYTVTANFSGDANIITEIVEVDLDDNPAGVISYSYTGNQATFNVLTPRAVYAESSTFVLSKEVSPIYNTSIDYNTKFSAKIKQSRIGNNFYSTKFHIPGNYLCSLKDDGYGNINLFEWIDTITPEYIRTVGTIDYDTGAVLIKDLNIIAVQDSRIFFRVESLDALAPTKEYLNLKSSQLVQSSTVTFPSGETVQISSYEKQTDLVILWAYIKARSYDISNPSVTLETREATYKIIILPDYDLSKQKILQTLAAETN
jgi:hypothetical protein